ncbi:CapA family protein [Miniphocaeibacter massiliensis]|uniref:CapA family protein n=1 Tax=Miniphocaeibacter massiliensis TaxID=2041841 RepID=UPI000C1BC44D|nr:CapA family protein [Miniphocaeibacter massiliensis]
MKKSFKGLLLLIIIIFTGCSSKTEKLKLISNDIEANEENYTAKITATGDIMYHPWTFRDVKDSDGNYDFSHFYQEMQDEIIKSDLMIGNFETTSTPSRKMSGFPMFNTPEKAIEDLKKSGFDILTTANNHCIDSGKVGIEDTIDAFDKNGIKHTGTWKKGENKKYLIEEVNNIKIGFLAYTESFNGVEGNLKQDEKSMISPLNEEEIKKDIETLKDKKADFIVIFPHWGVEYSTKPNDFQKELGHKMLDWGADVILGSHPHVIQPIEKVEKDGKEKYIIYSMGNSISGQRERYSKNSNTEAGVFVNLNIEKKSSENEAVIKNIEISPTWVKEEKNEGKKILEVVPMNEYLESGKLRSTVSSDNLNRILNIRKNSIDILESMGYETGL